MRPLPRVTTIKTPESTRKPARRLQTGTARNLSATPAPRRRPLVLRVHRRRRPPRACSGTHLTRGVGVDLGIKALAVLSTGEPVPNPRHLNRALRALRTASGTLSRRVGPHRRTGQQPPRPAGKRPRREVTRIHTRVANPRTDAIHKLTTDVATTYGTVVVEDLTVSGMLGE